MTAIETNEPGLSAIPRTPEELSEILTLERTRNPECRVPVLLCGSAYWTEIVNIEALVRRAMISR